MLAPKPEPALRREARLPNETPDLRPPPTSIPRPIADEGEVTSAEASILLWTFVKIVLCVGTPIVLHALGIL